MPLRVRILALSLLLHTSARASEQNLVLVPDFSGKTLQQVQTASISKASGKSIFAAIDTQGATGANAVVASQIPEANKRVVPGTARLVLTMKGPSLLQTILQGFQNAKPATAPTQGTADSSANTAKGMVPPVAVPGTIQPVPVPATQGDAPPVKVPSNQGNVQSAGNAQQGNGLLVQPKHAPAPDPFVAPGPQPRQNPQPTPFPLSTPLVLFILAVVVLAGGVGWVIKHIVTPVTCELVPHRAAPEITITTKKPGLRFTLTFHSQNTEPAYRVPGQPVVRSMKRTL